MAETNLLNTSSEELRDLIIATLVLAFGFSIIFPGVATLGNWFKYFVLDVVLVGISIFIHELVHRAVAARLLATVKSTLWRTGALATLATSIITGGLFVFAAPWAVTIQPRYFIRPGTINPKAHIGPHDTALIAISGPAANFGLAVLAKLLEPALGIVAQELIGINVALAVFNLFPFFTVFPIIFARLTPFVGERLRATPYVEGEFVFFGSRPLWAFTFTFFVIGGLSLLFLSLATSLILALVLSAAIWLAWFYFLEGAAPYEMLKKEKF